MATMATETQQTQSSTSERRRRDGARRHPHLRRGGHCSQRPLRRRPRRRARASSPASWARRAPASRPSCTSSPGWTSPPEGDVAIDGTSIAELSDTELTKLRRRAHRLRLPVLQPAPDADRRGEHRPPTRARRRQDRQGLDRLRSSSGSASPTGASTARRSSRAASSSASPSPAPSSRRPTVVFADEPTGQPRLDDQPGDPRAPARVRRNPRPDLRHGLARPEGDRDRRPNAVPRRRPASSGSSARRRPHEVVETMEEVSRL